MSERYGKRQGPRRVLLYGIHGIGKSTWANQPGVKFFDVEDGLGDIDLHLEPIKIKSYGDFLAGVNAVIANPTGIRAICIDTCDALERLIWQHVATSAGKTHIEDFGYGKGYEFAVSKWQEVVKALTYLREQFGISWILLGHCQAVKIKPPGMESYDQYQPDIHSSARSYLAEFCTEVLFATYETFVKQEDLGFNKTRSIALGGTRRMIHTTHTAIADAKNRLGMPDTINFDFWGTEADPGFGRFLPKPAAAKQEQPTERAPVVEESAIDKLTTTKISMDDVFAGITGHSNIDGLVRDGSSKQPA